jgi:hypothetical protein
MIKELYSEFSSLRLLADEQTSPENTELKFGRRIVLGKGEIKERRTHRDRSLDILA